MLKYNSKWKGLYDGDNKMNSRSLYLLIICLFVSCKGGKEQDNAKKSKDVVIPSDIKYVDTVKETSEELILFDIIQEDALKEPVEEGIQEGADKSSDVFEEVEQDGTVEPEPEIIFESKEKETLLECESPQDCVENKGKPKICYSWSCNNSKCLEVVSPEGESCQSGDLCIIDESCDGKGQCIGKPKVCDDGDPCTDDSCVSDTGQCQHKDAAPKVCIDAQGNSGFQFCKNGKWGECIVPKTCELKINTNDTGTVNPFVSQGRSGAFYVSYVASEDGGGNLRVAWIDPIKCEIAAGPFKVNDIPGDVYYWGAQSVISDGAGNFYAVWETLSSKTFIGFSASESVQTFPPFIEVVSTSENGLFPSLAVKSVGHVIVVWTGYIKGENGAEYDPFISINQDVFGGKKFSPGVQVTSTKTQDDSTAVAVDGFGNIYVAWESFQDSTPEGGNIYVAKSTDGGKTFSAPVQVNDVPSKAQVGIGTFMAWGKDRLYVVWSDTRNDYEGDIYIDSSPDGITFGQDILVNDNTNRNQEDPSIVVGAGPQCDGHVYVVWQDMRSNKDYDIYGAKSIDKGKTFLPNKLLNQTLSKDQMNPSIAIDATCVVGVAWRDSSENSKFDIKGVFLPKWD